MNQRGVAMGVEHRGKGVNVALGPMTNLGRVAAVIVVLICYLVYLLTGRFYRAAGIGKASAPTPFWQVLRRRRLSPGIRARELLHVSSISGSSFFFALFPIPAPFSFPFRLVSMEGGECALSRMTPVDASRSNTGTVDARSGDD
jgi:hypothetical protein